MSKLKVRVNRKGAESLTRQITNQLTGLINTGALAVGELLPSERTLANSLGVARNVIRRSYDYLASGNLIQGEGRRGRRVGSTSSRKSGGAGAAASASKKRSAGSRGSKKSSPGKGGKRAGKKSSKAAGRKNR